MLTLKEKDIVKEFDDAMNHRNKAGSTEYRLLQERCLKVAPLLVARMQVQDNTVATHEWRWHHQKELKATLEAALHYLNKIEAGEWDKRTL